MKIKFLSVFLLVVLVSCMQPVPRKPVTKKTSSFMETSISLNKKLNEKEEALFKAIIQKDSLVTYITSSSGFWYTYNVKSKNTYTPQLGDHLLYSCEIYTVENEIIYSAQELGLQSYLVDKQEVVEGLRNGLKLMHEGDVVTFLFPSHKVFGYLGDEKKIGINQPLIYKVQLNKINKKNESN
ncbi:gliding motility-associated peptidyl-prolyl isomerase GldI [Lutibacter holmesii]|uniref:Peptidyl-prolyl cis-trans isomerase n=1 Tax=Lutibacter holmesii TaxID=1137985 RepID=A0ABW3WLY1_9FLAO